MSVVLAAGVPKANGAWTQKARGRARLRERARRCVHMRKRDDHHSLGSARALSSQAAPREAAARGLVSSSLLTPGGAAGGRRGLRGGRRAVAWLQAIPERCFAAFAYRCQALPAELSRHPLRRGGFLVGALRWGRGRLRADGAATPGHRPALHLHFELIGHRGHRLRCRRVQGLAGAEAGPVVQPPDGRVLVMGVDAALTCPDSELLSSPPSPPQLKKLDELVGVGGKASISALCIWLVTNCKCLSGKFAARFCGSGRGGCGGPAFVCTGSGAGEGARAPLGALRGGGPIMPPGACACCGAAPWGVPGGVPGATLVEAGREGVALLGVGGRAAWCCGVVPSKSSHTSGPAALAVMTASGN
eukprot:CAMPEP_0177271354 /NCGR_PEP_ID=MMETSP0367-20130122/65478_1 /TAXON_ID=447022 ORGANISM="Scrippsiella hangoei-like, Strain SHHI-4" /NCGR_SAMPLE_ID=MMETSP0367 /ASSEMBLY_ACC=CAM_ASM_000362 /LENGTH=359 /DNA_ID=CAMNT_0018727395 /DNA_START=15 /DNA_END=1094 /DNA_ORIENTATION=-